MGTVLDFFPKNRARRRRWMVICSSPKGIGRAFLTTDDVPLSKALIRSCDVWLKEKTYNPEAFVISMTPLELVDEKDFSGDDYVCV